MVGQPNVVFSRCLAVFALTVCGLAAANAFAHARPNIVLIVADDMGHGDLGCYGAPDIKTPTLDRLAKQGVRFTRFYANGPECTPTRTALLTGRYQQRVGGLECAIGTDNVGRYDDAIRLAEKGELGLPASETTIARDLKSAGYSTALYGKWHLGYEDKFSPNAHGFDDALYFLGGNTDHFLHREVTGKRMLRYNGTPFELDGMHTTDWVTERSIAFIQNKHGWRKNNEPFFLCVWHAAPHFPYQGPNDHTGKLFPEATWNKGTRGEYVEMVEHMDRSINLLLAAIDLQGLRDNTVVIFMSDNGGDARGSNAPFRGNKGGLFEGGIREPLIIHWPGHLEGGRTADQLAMSFDLTKSIARIANTKARDARNYDGVDILDLVEKGQPAPPRNLFWRARRGERTWRAVLAGDLKYVSKTDGKEFDEWLFDLLADPGEKNSLLNDRADDATRLKSLLKQWENDVRHKR